MNSILIDAIFPQVQFISRFLYFKTIKAQHSYTHQTKRHGSKLVLGQKYPACPHPQNQIISSVLDRS